MNDKPTQRDQWEERVTAYLLGELTQEESAQVEHLMQEDAILAAFGQRMKKTLGLVRESLAVGDLNKYQNQEERRDQDGDEIEAVGSEGESFPARLSEARRRALLKRFRKAPSQKTTTPRVEWARYRWLIPVSLAASLIVFLGLESVMRLRSASGVSRQTLARKSFMKFEASGVIKDPFTEERLAQNRKWFLSSEPAARGDSSYSTAPPGQDERRQARVSPNFAAPLSSEEEVRLRKARLQSLVALKKVESLGREPTPQSIDLYLPPDYSTLADGSVSDQRGQLFEDFARPQSVSGSARPEMNFSQNGSSSFFAFDAPASAITAGEELPSSYAKKSEISPQKEEGQVSLLFRQAPADKTGDLSDLESLDVQIAEATRLSGVRANGSTASAVGGSVGGGMGGGGGGGGFRGGRTATSSGAETRSSPFAGGYALNERSVRTKLPELEPGLAAKAETEQSPGMAGDDIQGATVNRALGLLGRENKQVDDMNLALNDGLASAAQPSSKPMAATRNPSAAPQDPFSKSLAFEEAPALTQVQSQRSDRGRHSNSMAVAEGLAERPLVELRRQPTLERAPVEKAKEVKRLSSELKEDVPLTETKFNQAGRTAVLAEREMTVDEVVSPTLPVPAQPLPEMATAQNAFSTFSLNVSDVSFKLAGASLANGQMPDPGRVRSEEFINAFDYRDPAPAPGARVGFSWGQARHPFEHNRHLIRFSVQTAAAGREPGQPLNLVLLVDNSGSMERADRVQIINEALTVLAGLLTDRDVVSVVSFARTPSLWIDGLRGGQPEALVTRVRQLNPQGGTNLELAMDLAYEVAQKHFRAEGNNRVILLTDGAANLGNVQPAALQQKVEAFRKQGIAIDCFGVGWEGYNDDLLEVLTRHGDGRYGFLNDPQEAATEFAGRLAGALQVAASDVKAQVEFNPQRVTTWRQVGYEKHQLTKEQFRDNTVDAAEIGVAESGTALYSIQINPQGTGPLGVVRVRFKVPSTGRYQEQEWVLPYDSRVATLDQAEDSMKLATVAASFAEWLARSPYAGNVTLSELQQQLSGLPERFSLDPRPRQLATMIQQAQRITGE